MSMDRKVVCLVAGTRPEVIKLAPVYFAILKSSRLTPVWISTGQHKEMLDQAMKAFDLKSDYNLELMRDGQSLSELTARALQSVDGVLSSLRPRAMLVQGDTTTVLASALAAFYQKIDIGHVEAGLRTYNINSPWPEEMNRRLISPICRWNFAPTEQAKRNLVSEKIESSRCFVTGNTVIDSLLWMKQKCELNPVSVNEWKLRLGISNQFWSRYLGGQAGRMILLTLHRRESFGAGLNNICLAIREILKRFPDYGVICPMHLNPSAREPVLRNLQGLEQVALIEPVGYEDFIFLMNSCSFIISDSGGVQEEAPTLGKPILVARETSERMEGVENGTSRLVGTNADVLVREVSLLLEDSSEYMRRATLKNPYGDGTAALRICEVLEREIG